jgi:secreted PhoX family phosphatase
MADGKTVYLTDDFVPGIFYKFVSDVADDYTEGQLYAYKQGANGVGGTWIEIERDLDSLINARDVAVRKGATMFSRLEWVVADKSGSKLWITETGNDASNFNAGLAMGGTLPTWAARLDTMYGLPADNVLADRYGRVLEFNLNNNTMYSFLEGGNSTDGKTHFTNPDGLAYGKIKGKEYLIINEDLNGSTFGRMPYAAGGAFFICEIFVLDLDIKNPTVDDLHRLAIGPYGSETTGGVLTKNGDTYFVNVQHPSSSNPFPFNNSTTVAIRGFGNFVAALVEKDEEITQAITDLNSKYENIEDAPLAMFPNPATRFVSFNKATDVEVYNTAGQLLISDFNTTRIDISTLSAGVYYVRTASGENMQLIVE